jgi:hypothetical protein
MVRCATEPQVTSFTFTLPFWPAFYPLLYKARIMKFMLNDQSSLSPGGAVRLSGDIHSVILELS